MKQICLYLKKNMDIDGEGEDKPIANSLKELINNMNVNPNIRKKEENKCCLLDPGFRSTGRKPV